MPFEHIPLPVFDPFLVQALFFISALLTGMLLWSSRQTRKVRTRAAFKWAGIRSLHEYTAIAEEEGHDNDSGLRPDTPPNWLGKVRLGLKEAGIYNLTAVEWIGVQLITVFVVFGLLFIVTQSLVLGLVSAFVAYRVPASRVSGARGKLRRKIDRQLLKSSLRIMASQGTGSTMPSAIAGLSEVIDNPLGHVYEQLSERVENGMSFDAAMRLAETEVPSDEFKMFSLAIRSIYKHGSGVGFKETMELLAKRLQERERLRSEAAASFRQMKGGYYFVLFIVVLLGFYLHAQDPVAYDPLLVNPVGQVVTFFMAGLAYLGHRIIQNRSKLEAAL